MEDPELRFVDRVGQKFGLLTIVARAPGRTPGGKTIWLCDCECGTRGHAVDSSNIKTAKGCGCLRGYYGPPPRREALTQARIKQMLRYEPETGNFFWRVAPVNRPDLVGRRAGCQRPDGYWCIAVDGRVYMAHRLVWLYEHGCFPDAQLDHKDRNRLDGRIANLRKATPNQNTMNSKMPRTNSTGFKGVCWNKRRDKYRVRIGFRGKVVDLGFYKTAPEAARAYDYVARRVFGEFAMTNKALGLLGPQAAGPQPCTGTASAVRASA